MIDGYHAGNSSGQVALSNGTVCTNLNADMIDGYHAGNSSGQVALSNGTVCTNLNADMIDGFHASQTPQANTIPVADSSNKIADGWLSFVANDPKVKTALNAFGYAPIYACRAWVNFDGTTSPPTIYASGNVSSITKNGTGDFTINFVVSMVDVCYAVVGSTEGDASGNGTALVCLYYDNTANKSTSWVRIYSSSSDTISLIDKKQTSVIIVR
jgi:hypothetical protein